MCSLSNWISPVPLLNDVTGGKFSKLTPGLKYVDPATMVGADLVLDGSAVAALSLDGASDCPN